MHIIIAQMSHETNTYSPVISDLARFKRPKAYAFIQEIPRSASGKLMRRHLRTGDYKLLDGYQHSI